MNRHANQLFCIVALGSATGCISTPPIAVVSTNTALMAQAAGEMPEVTYRATQAGLKPGVEKTPRERLPEGNNTAFEKALRINWRNEGEWQKIDRLLRAHCVGEANTGLLVNRPDECEIEVETAKISPLISRMNVHRRQLWSTLATEESTDLAQVSNQWRKVHRERIVCGALVQGADGGWGKKEC